MRRIRKGASFLCALLFGFTLAFSGGKCRFFSVSPKEKAIRELRAYPENIRNERLYDFARAYIDRYLSDYGEREIACWKAVTDLSGRGRRAVLRRDKELFPKAWRGLSVDSNQKASLRFRSGKH